MPIAGNVEMKERRKENAIQNLHFPQNRQEHCAIFILDFCIFFLSFFVRMNSCIVETLFLDGIYNFINLFLKKKTHIIKHFFSLLTAV